MQDKKKFIIIKIIGGLGNQIFQFCFAVIISKMTSRTLVVNNSRYFLSKKIKAYLKQITNSRYKNSFSKKFFFINFISNFKIFTTNYLDKNYFNITKNEINLIVKNKKKVLLLEGYWQSFKFLDQLNSKNFLEIFNKKFTKNDKKKNSKEICVHIRRGDYYNDSKVKEIHGILKFCYFSNAILRFEKKFNDNVNLIIFSDDIDFCKRLNFLQNKKNVEFFQSSDELLTFSEMSNYKNYIISNSTYSLLAAYFSARKYGSINIAMPDQWVANVKTNSTQLISKYFNMV
jgi:hypothetical protein